MRQQLLLSPLLLLLLLPAPSLPLIPITQLLLPGALLLPLPRP
jgi:hypothetical protein